MVFIEKDSFRNLRRLPTDSFRSIPRLPREDLVLPVAASDLVAWYPFRSGSAEDLTAGDSRFGDTTDYSAVVNGATFQANGGVTDIQTGANSGAFDFDGVDDTIDLGTVADSDQSLTLMLWVKPDTVSKRFHRFFSKLDGFNAGENGSIVLSTDSDGDRPRFAVSIKSNNAVILGNTMAVDTFVHLAGRYDFQSGTITLFQNGTPVGNSSPGQAPALSQREWRVGEDKPTGAKNEFLDGTADGVRIYDAALSDSQINQIYLNTEP